MSRWPSRFTPARSPAPSGGDETRLAQSLDLFSIGDRFVREQLLAVGVDPSGRLSVASAREPGRFYESAHQQLVLHQVSAKRAPRHLAVDQLWLFDLQVVEQLSDANTLNDPVFLYGTLFGPVSEQLPLEARQGQLAVTRADVLEAFLRSVPHRFGASASQTGGGVELSHGLLLPGESDELLAQGTGFILALPVPPPELADAGGNGAQVRFVIHQLLEQLQGDLDGKKRSKLSKLFVASPKVVPGPHARVDELADCCTRALALMDDWPAPRVSTVFDRVQDARAMAPTFGSASSAPLTRAPPRTSAPRNDDWMRDFVSAHQSEGRPPERVVSVTPAAGSPAWMADFDQGKPAEPTRPEPAPSTGKPDWMKDFE